MLRDLQAFTKLFAVKVLLSEGTCPCLETAASFRPPLPGLIQPLPLLPSHYKGRMSKRCASILTWSSSARPFLSLWGQWKHRCPLGPKTLTCHFLISSSYEPELNLLIKTTACPSPSTGAGFAVASEGALRGCVTAPAWGRVTVLKETRGRVEEVFYHGCELSFWFAWKCLTWFCPAVMTWKTTGASSVSVGVRRKGGFVLCPRTQGLHKPLCN